MLCFLTAAGLGLKSILHDMTSRQNTEDKKFPT